MRKKFLSAALAFPIIILLCWTAALQYRASHSPLVRIAAQGYDPRDLFSGHYLQMSLDWQKTDCGQFPDHKCPKEDFDYVYRYYLDEKYAEKLERLLWKLQPGMELEFALVNGSSPLVTNLYIEKEPWKSWYKKQKQQ